MKKLHEQLSELLFKNQQLWVIFHHLMALLNKISSKILDKLRA